MSIMIFSSKEFLLLVFPYGFFHLDSNVHVTCSLSLIVHASLQRYPGISIYDAYKTRGWP